jgi:First Longin domain of INTU, CCZ1 and HPS4
MSRLPPALLYLTIYNPTLKPSGPIADDDEDAEEQAHILFYTSRERAVSRDKMLRQVGLAKALVNFSEYATHSLLLQSHGSNLLKTKTKIKIKQSAEHRMFAPEDTCDNVHSQSRRMLMVSPEPGFWIHAVSFKY